MAGRSGRELQALRNKKKKEQTGSTQKSQSSVSKNTNRNGGGRTGGLTKQQVQQKVSKSPGYTSQGKARQPISSTTKQNNTQTRNYASTQNNARRSRINGSAARGREQTPINRREQTPINRRQQTYNTAADMRKAQEEDRNKRASDTEARSRMSSPATAMEMRQQRTKDLADKKDNKVTETIKTSGEASKKGALDALSGHAQTALDALSGLTSDEKRNYLLLRSAELNAGIDNKAQTKKNAKEAVKASEYFDEERRKLNTKQEQRQAEFDKRTKNASGMQKAIYGAVESGTGMLSDMAVGAATGTGQAGALAAMFSRTYGTTRGQAEKEGATEREDRLYAALQGSKEVATELMFPGWGLAKGYAGKTGLKAGERLANALTRNMRGKAADVAYAGLRALGGTAEENAEEIAGWALDPFIKDIAYGKNVRNRAKEQLLSDMPELTSREDAEALNARLNSGSFVEELASEYEANGLSKKRATELAEKMRDLYSAYYAGDADAVDKLGDEVAGELTGAKKVSKESFSTSDLMETIASTTLLTATTGIPGAITTAQRGAMLRDELGTDGLKALAKQVLNSEDAEASERGKAAQAALEAGRDITSTQVYDLEQNLYQQQEKDIKRQGAQLDTAGRQISENRYVTPFAMDQQGRIVHMEKATLDAYNEAAESAKANIKDIDTKESLTDTDVMYGARAIAGFRTGAFTIDDANTIVADEAVKQAFSEQTGIDLSKYEVKNKDGSINIPKTNAATKDALFAMAADNLVKMAEVETANWMDEARGETVRQVTARMGAKGNIAAQLALDDVDERDVTKYRSMAAVSDYVYQSALNIGVSWDDAKDAITSQFSSIPESKLQMIYEAGLADREIANDKMLGLQANLGEAMSKNGERAEDPTKGQCLVETEQTPKGSVIRVFSDIADNLGINIHLVDNLAIDEEGKKQANGEYHDGDIYINVNSTFEENLGFIFMHEVTHHLKKYAPEQYKALENLVREEWFKYNPDQMQSEIAKKIEQYKKATNGKRVLTEEEALEEIIADATHEFLMDKNFAKQVADTEPSLAKAVLNSIREMMHRLRQIFSSGKYENSKTYMNSFFSQIGILEDAERLWLDAYTEAVKNKAAVGVVKWQEEANRQSDRKNSITPEQDSEGNELSEGQREYFKDSKVVDENGNLLRMYHGTADEFYEFSRDKIGRHGKFEGAGFNFTPSEARARSYSSNGEGGEGYVMGGYLNITNPLSAERKTMSIGQLAYLIMEIDPTGDDIIANYAKDASDYGTKKFVEREAFTAARAIHDYEENDVDIYSDLSASGANPDSIINVFKDMGYDGLIHYYEDGKIQTAIAFDSNQFKLADNTEPTENADVRYSIAPEIREDIEEKGVDITESGTAVKYSLTSWNDTDKEALLNNLVDAGFDKKIAKKWISDVDSVAANIYGDLARLNYEADRHQDALKPNSEYFYTLDLSTLCQKRRLYQGTYNAIMHRLVNIALQPKDTVRLREMMEEMDLETPCGICYEESRKKNEGKFADTWLNGETDSQFNQRMKNYQKTLENYKKKVADYEKLSEEEKAKKKAPKEPTPPERWMGYANMEHDDPYVPTLADVTTTDGRAKLREEHPDVLEAYLDYQKGRGSANPKVSFTHTDYRGDILRMTKTDVDNVKHIGGLRIQSFSDFETVHVIDMMQAIMDMASMKLTSQAYTKVPAFADIFGGTGVKINLSLIQKMDENDNPVYEEYIDEETGEKKKRLVFDSKEGIDSEEAFRLREKYPKNVGTILVGVSEEQIRAAWDDPRVDMVIPFHRSGWAKDEFERLGLVGYEDFQEFQSERHWDAKEKKWISLKDAKMEELYSIDYWDKNLSGKENAKKYLKECAELHRRPVFYNFLTDNGDGTWSLPEDGTADGYWKSLIDFKMYDNKGEFAPQQEVKPVFDMEAAQKAMDAYEGNADTLPVNNDVVEAYLKDFKKRHPRAKLNLEGDARLSISVELDDQYMSAVNSGNMEEAQKLVDQAAKRAGMRVAHRYHGTMNAGFTVFDKAYAKVGGNSGAGFYFSTAEEDSADHYADVEGADNYFKWSDLAEQIHEAVSEGTWEGHPELGIYPDDIETYEDAEEAAKKILNREPGIYDVYLNYKNPYVRNFRQSTNIFPKLADDFDESIIDRNDYDDEDDYYDALRDAEWEHFSDKIYQAVHDAFDDIENFYDVLYAPNLDSIISGIISHAMDYESLTWSDIADVINNDSQGWLEVTRIDWSNSAEATTEFVRAIVENFGYDAIEDKEVSSKFGQLSREMQTDTEHIIVFKPEQIKLSDPVTYAEDGSVIPLSERFDPNNDDIRYSLPTEDSDGNILTDGQMEYFKNSQARDEQGRLIPMYHVTPIGGFTIFDPAYSFDETSISFSNSLDFALNYSSDDGNPDDWRAAAETRLGDGKSEGLGHYKAYLNMENPLVVTDDMFEEMDIYEWPAYAKANGYDGVIHRDFDGEGGDIYQVFSSNQVKDVGNENPTEIPDIRYSFTPEDEAKSSIAYEDSIDDSYDELAKYEMMLDEGKFTDNMLSKPFSEDEVARFYAGLRSTEPRIYSDPILQEDAVRLAKSKDEFFNNVNAKWQDRWTTGGEVLKVESVRKDIQNLVIGTMSNSDTPVKYRNEIVRKTLIDARVAFQLMKQDRTDVASALLYHSAQRMIDGVEFIQDDMFKQYKDLRDYLRTTRISLGDEYWSDANYDAFRKRNAGRIKLIKGNTNVYEVYQEMCERWPEWFNEEEEMVAPDMLLQMEHVLDVIQPYKEAYTSEEAASLCFDIADELYEVIAKGDEVVSLADRYKNKFDRQTKAMKERHEEALRKVREERDKGIKAERAKWKVREQARKEKDLHRQLFNSIAKSHKTLVDRLRTNTADKHIPEQYKKDLAGLLAAFDLQTVASKEREAKTYHRSQKAIQMSAIRTALRQIEAKSELFHVNDSITDIIDELLGVNAEQRRASTIEGKTLDELSVSELQRIDKLLKALIHEFNTYENVRVNARNVMAEDLSKAQVTSAIDHAKKFGEGSDWFGIRGWLDKIINMDEVTPAYMFKMIDPNSVGLGQMWKEIKRSHDKYIRNTDQLTQWMDEIIGKYHSKGRGSKKYGAKQITEWRSSKNAQTFNLTNGSITLTQAQMMSVACLYNRTQACKHMIGAGVVAAPISFQNKLETDLKRKTNYALPLRLTDEDIKQIVTSLTPEQKKVAEDLQQLMATKMAEWGNEASMDVIGIKLFEETDYFPIKSDKAALQKDWTADQFDQAIRNFGFTKAVQPGARNAIVIDDIFEVVAEHCNNMNLYNAYSKTLNDFMKVYNKHTIMEDGSDYSVAQAISHAYSQKATNFIMEFVKDLNGNVSTGKRTGIDAALNESLAKAKKAAVFANVRVFLQQPTAITRAFAVISPKYLKGVSLGDIAKGIIPTVTTDAMQEMFDHCPIAKWKSWGYYDINMGKTIEDVIMNEGNWLEDLATDAYGKADNITWTAIWQMVKEEMKDTHPDVEIGTDEYWELCNERMSEIVDYTQVVDSPLHRSHAMRSKSFMTKMFTSFMAEPTLTFNMMRDAFISAKEAWASGDKSKAGKLMGRAASVYMLQAVTVSAAAAIADALRGKTPDGDDDEDRGFGSLWWINTLNNFKDEMKIWNKVYYVKDLASMLEGWDQRNLALQGWADLFNGFSQLQKKLYEGSKVPWWKIYSNLLGGFGSLIGVPIKTIMKDGRAIFELFGGHLPESLVGDSKNNPVVNGNSGVGKIFAPKSDSDNATSVNISDDDHWYDYENNPITVEDGSPLDKFLNRLGVNLTEAEKAAAIQAQKDKEFAEERERIKESVLDLTGEEKEKATWKKVSEYVKETEGKSFEDLVIAGDYATLGKYRKMYLAAGNAEDYFDQMIYDKSKSALKKTIIYDPTEDQIASQENIKNYLLSHGMTETEMSEIAYKSETKKDLQVACRIGDKDAMVESLRPLISAGLTYEDFVRIYENRNRVDLVKYKNKGGRYADKLKSRGTFIWPTQGTVTSHFGYRNAPTAGASSNHPAIDIGASTGTPVVAADGGVVIYTGCNGGYGNSVGIKHDNGMVTYYNHLYAYNVKQGDTVSQGQQIAQVGSTGISTGPHLDFKILDKNGKPVDPEQYLN